MPLLTRRRLLSAGFVAMAGLSARLLVRAPLRIGILGDLSTPRGAARSRGMLLAATMALEEVGNRALGRPLQVLAGDTQGDPALTRDVAAHWVDQARAAALLHGGDPATGVAVVPSAARRGAVMLWCGDPAETACAPALFHFTPSPASLATAALSASLASGVRRWFCLADGGPPGAAWQDEACRAIAAAGGTVVGAIDRRVGPGDLALAEQVRAADVAGLVFTAEGADFVDGFRQARDLGLTQGRALVGLRAELADVAAIGPDAAGLQFATVFHPAMTDNALAWSRRFESRGHAAPGWRQALAYTATLHYLRAVQAVGAATGEAVAAWMQAQPVRSILVRQAAVRADGRVMIDLAVVRVRGGTRLDAFDAVEQVATWRSPEDGPGRSACVLPPVTGR